MPAKIYANLNIKGETFGTYIINDDVLKRHVDLPLPKFLIVSGEWMYAKGQLVFTVAGTLPSELADHAEDKLEWYRKNERSMDKEAQKQFDRLYGEWGAHYKFRDSFLREDYKTFNVNYEFSHIELQVKEDYIQWTKRVEPKDLKTSLTPLEIALAPYDIEVV